MNQSVRDLAWSNSRQPQLATSQQRRRSVLIDVSLLCYRGYSQKKTRCPSGALSIVFGGCLHATRPCGRKLMAEKVIPLEHFYSIVFHCTFAPNSASSFSAHRCGDGVTIESSIISRLPAFPPCDRPHEQRPIVRRNVGPRCHTARRIRRIQRLA